MADQVNQTQGGQQGDSGQQAPIQQGDGTVVNGAPAPKPEPQGPVNLEDLDLSQLGPIANQVDAAQQALDEKVIHIDLESAEPKITIQGDNKDQVAPGQDGTQVGNQDGQQTVDNRPEYLKKTPYKTNEEMAEGFHKQRVALDKLANEQGEVRKLGTIDEIVAKLTELTQLKGPNPPQPFQQGAPENVAQFSQQAPQQQQPGQQQAQVDLYDPAQLGGFIQQQVQNSIAQGIKPMADFQQAQVKDAEEFKFRQQAEALAIKYPEYALQDNLDVVVGKIQQAKTLGVEPTSLHPEANKVLAVVDLLNAVKGSNGTFKSLEEAHKWKAVQGKGLDELLLSERRTATIDTVNQINNNQSGAQTISDAGGQAVQPKTLADLSIDQLKGLVEKLPDEE